MKTYIIKKVMPAVRAGLIIGALFFLLFSITQTDSSLEEKLIVSGIMGGILFLVMLNKGAR